MLDEKNEVHNRVMRINKMLEEVDIESAKVDIESEKVDIENKVRAFTNNITEKTISHAFEIF